MATEQWLTIKKALELGMVVPADVVRCLDKCKSAPRPIAQVFVEEGLITEGQRSGLEEEVRLGIEKAQAQAAQMDTTVKHDNPVLHAAFVDDSTVSIPEAQRILAGLFPVMKTG